MMLPLKASATAETTTAVRQNLQASSVTIVAIVVFFNFLPTTDR